MGSLGSMEPSEKYQRQIKYKLNMNSLFDLYLINLNKMGNPEGTTSFTMVYLGWI
jgi:hypothetical protein